MTGYTFTQDALRDLVDEWTELAQHYQESRLAARQMVLITKPGKDDPSASYVTTAGTSGNDYAEVLEAKIDYCWDQADKFQKALDDYLGVEHHNVRQLHEAGRAQPGI